MNAITKTVSIDVDSPFLEVNSGSDAEVYSIDPEAVMSALNGAYQPICEALPKALTPDRLADLTGLREYDIIQLARRLNGNRKPSPQEARAELHQALTTLPGVRKALSILGPVGHRSSSSLYQAAIVNVILAPPTFGGAMQRISNDPVLGPIHAIYVHVAAAITSFDHLGKTEDKAILAWLLGARHADPSMLSTAVRLWPEIADELGAVPASANIHIGLIDRTISRFHQHLLNMLCTLGSQVGDGFIVAPAPADVMASCISIDRIVEDPAFGAVRQAAKLHADSEQNLSVLFEALGRTDLIAAIAGSRAPLAYKTFAIAYALLALAAQWELESRQGDVERLKTQAAEALQTGDFSAVERLAKRLNEIKDAPTNPFFEPLDRVIDLFREYAVVEAGEIEKARSRAMAEFINRHADCNADGMQMECSAPIPSSTDLTAAPMGDQQAETQITAAIEERLSDAEGQRDAAEAEAMRLAAEVSFLLDRLAVLEGATMSTPAASRSKPATLADVSAWAEEALAGRLVLTERAKRGLKRGVYEDVPTVVGSLDLLAGLYRDAKLPGGGGKEALAVVERRCRELGIEICIAASERGLTCDNYWSNHEGRRYLLDMHVRKGTSRDARKTMRLYFCFDTESQTVIVGAGPEHLANSLT